MAANPVDYVGRSLRGKHLVILHEDPIYAQLVEYYYLLHNLESEKTCLYLTYQQRTLAERQMVERGLDVASFEQKKQLQILRIRSRTFDFWKIVDQITHEANKHRNSQRWRILWRFDKKRYNAKELSAHIQQDGEVQNALEDRYGATDNKSNRISDFGSILCSYPMDKTSLADPRIVRHHINNHDAVILIPKHGAGTVLQSNGLEKSNMEAWIRNRLET